MTKNQRKFIRGLHQKKRREQAERFLVEGEKNVVELLQSDRFEVAELFASTDFLEKYAALSRPMQVWESSPKDLAQAGTFQSNDQALAVVHIPPPLPLPKRLSGLVLALDQIRDPGNLGTILRIADWYGTTAVLCAPQSVELYNPKVIAASMGSFLRVPVWEVELSKALTDLKLPVWGALMEGENLHELKPPEDLLVVIGSESHGISPEICQYVQQGVTIPRFGAAESLNAGVATAIFCDHWRRSFPM